MTPRPADCRRGCLFAPSILPRNAACCNTAGTARKLLLQSRARRTLAWAQTAGSGQPNKGSASDGMAEGMAGTTGRTQANPPANSGTTRASAGCCHAARAGCALNCGHGWRLGMPAAMQHGSQAAECLACGRCCWRAVIEHVCEGSLRGRQHAPLTGSARTEPAHPLSAHTRPAVAQRETSFCRGGNGGAVPTLLWRQAQSKPSPVQTTQSGRLSPIEILQPSQRDCELWPGPGTVQVVRDCLVNAAAPRAGPRQSAGDLCGGPAAPDALERACQGIGVQMASTQRARTDHA